MRLSKLKIDSALLKLSLFELFNFEEDFLSFEEYEEKYISNKKPDIVQIKIKSDDIQMIRFFEQNGFCFSEFKISLSINLNQDTRYTSVIYPYKLTIVNNREQLKQVKEIARHNVFPDRFTNNNNIPKHIALERNIKFLEKSFLSKNECIACIIDQINDRIISYKSFERKGKNSIILYLDGISVEYQHVADKLDYLYYNWFVEHEHFFIKEYISAGNREELNKVLKKSDYQIESTFVILEKMYIYQ